ncbi:MAG: PAS domain S-box protein [bacterium]|nr:PAS domain S-box protein [bacterium]
MEKDKNKKDNFPNNFQDYINIVENFPDNLAIFNIPEGELVYFNKAAQQFFGYTKKSVENKHFTDFIHKADIKKVSSLFLKRIKGQKGLYQYTVRVLDNKNNFRLVEVSSKPLFYDGKTRFTEIVFHDISEKMTLLTEIEKQKQIYQTFFESINLPLLIFNSSFKILKANTKARKLFKFQKPALDRGAISLKSIFSTSDFKLISEQLKDNKNISLNKVTLNIRSSYKTENICEILINNLPNKDEFIISLHDITEEVILKNRLKESEEKYRFISENSDDIIILCDRKGSILFANKTLEKKLGVKFKDVENHNFLTVIQLPNELSQTQFFSGNLNDYPKYNLRINIKNSKGEERSFDLTINCIELEGILFNYHLTLRDITESIKSETQNKILHTLSHRLFLANQFDSILRIISSCLLDLGNSVVLIEKFEFDPYSQEFIEINYDNLDQLQKLIGSSVKPENFNRFIKEYFNKILSETKNKFFLKKMVGQFKSNELLLSKIKILEEKFKKTKVKSDEKKFVSELFKLRKKLKTPEVKFTFPSKIFENFDIKYKKMFQLERIKYFYSILINNSLQTPIARLSLLRRDDKQDFSSNDTRIIKIISDYIGIAFDKTESIARIQSSEEKFKSVFEKANDIIFIINERFQIIDSNIRAKETFDLTSSQKNRSIFSLFKDRKIIDLKNQSDNFTNPINELELNLHLLSGEMKTFIFSSTPLELKKKRKIMLLLKDISEQIRKDEEILHYAMEIRKKNLELISLDKIKDDFLTNFSHEFRTPLSSILGYMNFIYNQKLGDINENQKKAIEVCLKNLLRLNSMINKIMDLSKLRGNYPYSFEKISLPEIIKENTDFILPEAQKKNITFNLTLPKKEFFTLGDRNSITQVFINILSNSIKYSPDNTSVRISLEIKKNRGIVSIKDAGEGIPQDQIPLIFKRFYQATNSEKKKSEGLGIGLSIVKEVLEKHNVNVNVDSSEGTGTKFELTFLPFEEHLFEYQKKPEQYLPENLKEKLKSLKFLFADDDLETLNFLKQIFKNTGIILFNSNDPAKIIEILKEEHPKIAFIDFILKGCNALEFLQILQKKYPENQTSIYILSPAEIPMIEQESLKFGAKGILNKPVNPANLKSILAQELDK